MTTLGPGVRVAVGWTPDDMCTEGGRTARLQKGTVYEGPFSPGDLLPRDYQDSSIGPLRLRNGTGENVWIVSLDDGHLSGVVESLLIPLDGGDPVETYKPEEVECES